MDWSYTTITELHFPRLAMTLEEVRGQHILSTNLIFQRLVFRILPPNYIERSGRKRTNNLQRGISDGKAL